MAAFYFFPFLVWALGFFWLCCHYEPTDTEAGRAMAQFRGTVWIIGMVLLFSIGIGLTILNQL